jgi:hypothetical protein
VLSGGREQYFAGAVIIALSVGDAEAEREPGDGRHTNAARARAKEATILVAW